VREKSFYRGYSSDGKNSRIQARGERVDLKGESEPLYTPVFLRVFSRLHQERVVLKGVEGKEGHNSCRMLHEYGGLGDMRGDERQLGCLHSPPPVIIEREGVTGMLKVNNLTMKKSFSLISTTWKRDLPIRGRR
jgi:hypothetical protein